MSDKKCRFMLTNVYGEQYECREKWQIKKLVAFLCTSYYKNVILIP